MAPMEPEPTAVGDDSAGSATNSGGPAPFLLKTYNMVDDSSTDDIVSWSSSNASFVVWKPPDFSSRLLPTYFKHNNFSSFIRQLNTYGFRKVDPERWEFANDEFVKGKEHLLKNIYRRKPIHSHSSPPLDAERATLEEEIERLQRDKAALQADLWRFKQQQSGTKAQLEVLERRLRHTEQRQAKMVAFLQRALQNPKFVENLAMMVGSSASVLHKKRRLPRVEHCVEAVENSSCNLKLAEVGHVFSQDFCDKLNLELCPATSDSNLVPPSIQGSHEGDKGPHGRQKSGGCVLRMDCHPSVPETVELSDAGASLCSRSNSLLAGALDDSDAALVSCHLNLTLASSSIQTDSSNNLSRILGSIDLGAASDPRPLNENAVRDLQDAAASPMREVSQAGIEAPLPPAGRVNDKFWEQFLTERPGSSNTEEAISSLSEGPCQESQEERMLRKENN